MGVLAGDRSNNGLVNSSDIGEAKPRSRLTGANFRADIDANGSLNDSDVELIRNFIGTALP